jgi:hypothetical protein
VVVVEGFVDEDEDLEGGVLDVSVQVGVVGFGFVVAWLLKFQHCSLFRKIKGQRGREWGIVPTTRVSLGSSS